MSTHIDPQPAGLTPQQQQPSTDPELEERLPGPGSQALAPMGGLHYGRSPLQRRPAALNGISARENAAVAHFTGGQVNLHAMGASLQRVPASDARLQAVGARSYAQGTTALVSDHADRGHELWHMAQQAMGRVQADTSIGGQRVNTAPALEAEADRMGAAIGRYQPTGHETGLAGTQAIPAVSGTIQRRVPDFEAEYDDRPPPTSDLLATLDYDYFNQSKKTVVKKISERLVPTKASDTPRPSKITATIGKNGSSDDTPKRQTHKSGMVGKFGMNEFFLRSGGTQEVFEGGHLIPHELWSDNDPDVQYADDYVNLVPMSRTLNVGAKDTWRNIESKLLEFTAALKGKKTFGVEIEIDHEGYELAYDRIASLFGLTIDPNYDGSDTIQMYSWLPKSLKPVKDPSKTTEEDLGIVVENQLHDTSSPIKSAADLIKALKQTPLWDRMTPQLQDDVENL